MGLMVLGNTYKLSIYYFIIITYNQLHLYLHAHGRHGGSEAQAKIYKLFFVFFLPKWTTKEEMKREKSTWRTKILKMENPRQRPFFILRRH